jgi:hypothetical protein
LTFEPEVELFRVSWGALLDAVAGLGDEAFDKPSGCAGWLVRDLVTHLVIGAQDILITLVTPAETEPTANAVSYWEIVERPNGEDPLDALVLGWPRPTASHDGSSSILTTSGPPRAEPLGSPIRPPASAPAKRFSPQGIFFPHTCSNGRCITSI